MSKTDKKDHKSDTEDGNYIKKDSEVKSENKSETKEENNKKTIYEELKEELKKVAENLEECAKGMIAKNKKERNLGEEVGGTEVDYEKEKSNKVVDFWDKDADKNFNGLADSEEVIDNVVAEDDLDNKKFIHRKKGRKGKGMKQMDLNNKDDMLDPKNKPSKSSKKAEKDGGQEIKKVSMIDKLNLSKWKLDRGNEDGGMMR